MRNTFLIIMILLNILTVGVTLNVHPGVSFLSLRVIFVAFSTFIALYLILLRKTKSDLILALSLFIIAIVHVSIIAKEVYNYIY